MRPITAVAVVPLLALAACGGQKVQTLSGPGSAARVTSTNTSPAAGSPAACRTADLSVRLGVGSGAAGSSYTPLVFTNDSQDACTLTGYPGVSFVAPHSGGQVGAAADRNRQHAAATVTLAPGGSAASVLQTIDPLDYDPATCQATAVSGLRVYPPGNTAAKYVAYPAVGQACSSHVAQLTVEAVVAGDTGS